MQEHHGMIRTPMWYVWVEMRARCRNPRNQDYVNYGGRGIRVCSKWDNSFVSFYNDMSPTYQPGLSIDRINNDGNYCPENCRWATRIQQTRNQRSNVYINTPQGRMTVAEAAEKFGLNVKTIRSRMNYGHPRRNMDTSYGCTSTQ